MHWKSQKTFFSFGMRRKRENSDVYVYTHILNPNKQSPYTVSHEKAEISCSKLTVLSLSLTQALVIVVLTFSQQIECDTLLKMSRFEYYSNGASSKVKDSSWWSVSISETSKYWDFVQLFQPISMRNKSSLSARKYLSEGKILGTRLSHR